MEIEEIRSKINGIDEQLLSLFLERMELAEDVAEYKNEHSLPITDRSREREILRRVKEEAKDKQEYAYQFFTKLIELSKAAQRDRFSGAAEILSKVEKALLPAETVFERTGTVACQGLDGANSQLACERMLPEGDIMFVKTFQAVFDAVGSGLCRYGVLPIENNTGGSVRSVYSLLEKRKFSIVRSVSLNIRYELLVKKGTKLSDITEIRSHEQAIAQCGVFLSEFKGSVNIIPCANTAVAAKEAAMSDGHIAAIANGSCRELYGLETLCDNIQDSDNNYTKFILIENECKIYAGSNRISLIVTCPNKPGGLSDVLSMFSSRGINMLKLESCPVSGRSFEFVFYIELNASVRDEGVMPILEELERTSESFTFLGNYCVI